MGLHIMGHFEKREWDQNTWHPEIAGVDFTKRLYKFIGDVALDGTEIYTAWLVTDHVEIQITPDSSRVFISLIDDDSDTITVLDPTDGLWFNFMRITHPESFEEVRELISPWSSVTLGITPMAPVYEKFLEVATKDTVADQMFIPDGWDE